MKLDKRTLKGIVKECLIEILAEGLVNPGNRQSSIKRQALKEDINRHRRTLKETSFEPIDEATPDKRKNTKRLSYLDKISFGAKEKDSVNYGQKVVESVSPKLAKDPIMMDILADTAQTTLQEQFSAESRRGISAPADAAAKIVSENDPAELFGEASQKWATLAFG